MINDCLIYSRFGSINFIPRNEGEYGWSRNYPPDNVLINEAYNPVYLMDRKDLPNEVIFDINCLEKRNDTLNCGDDEFFGLDLNTSRMLNFEKALKLHQGWNLNNSGHRIIKNEFQK